MFFRADGNVEWRESVVHCGGCSVDCMEVAVAARDDRHCDWDGGAVVIALPTLHEGRSTVAGVGMILAALVSYGVALNLASPLQQRNGALPVILRAQMVALVLVAPIGLHDVAHIKWAPGPLAALLALGVLSTGVAFAIMSISAGKFGATRASSAAFLIPAEALILE